MKIKAYHGTRKQFDRLQACTKVEDANGYRREFVSGVLYLTDNYDVAESYAVAERGEESVSPIKNPPTADRVVIRKRWRKDNKWHHAASDAKTPRGAKMAEFYGTIGGDDELFIENSVADTETEARAKAERNIVTDPRGMFVGTGLAKDGRVLKCEIDLENFEEYDWEGRSFHGVSKLIREAKEKGLDGIVIRNVRDAGGAYLPLAATIAVFNDKLVKVK